MKHFFLLSIFLLCGIASQAQEKVMNIQKTDGSSTQTRVAELDQISFLTVEQGGQGLLVKTVGGETVGVLFEANPLVTIASGKLSVTSDTDEAVVFEISDIAEIVFGDASPYTGIRPVSDFSLVLQDGGAMLRGIPQGVNVHVYTVDGRAVPAPAVSGGMLLLNRSSLGTGIYIIKVGSFTTKVKL